MPVRRHGSRGRMRETWPSARYDFAMRLLAADPTYVGEWQSQKSVEGANTTYEILNASFEMPMPETLDEAVRVVGPNIRSEERSVGKGGVSTCRSGGARNHKK